MNTQLQELIDCMQKGWNLYPANPTDGTDGDGETTACPLVHAGIGKTGEFHSFRYAENLFPILTKQRVEDPGSTLNTYDLSSAILSLADRDENAWSTPQVIEWLKTHLDD